MQTSRRIILENAIATLIDSVSSKRRYQRDCTDRRSHRHFRGFVEQSGVGGKLRGVHLQRAHVARRHFGTGGYGGHSCLFGFTSGAVHQRCGDRCGGGLQRTLYGLSDDLAPVIRLWIDRSGSLFPVPPIKSCSHLDISKMSAFEIGAR